MKEVQNPTHTVEELVALAGQHGLWPRMLEHVQQRQGAYGVNIGLFVLESGTDDYLPMAREALGLS